MPSIAAGTQVSDGSAFVTKSELSYRLNNLSNRMSILENSLDSRIDTLVSSYLTRNGIWNGAKQTLGSYKSLTNLSWSKCWDVIKTKTYGIVNKVVDGKTDDKYVLVNKTSKTGLVNVLANNPNTGIAIMSLANTGSSGGGKHSGWKVGTGNYTDHNYYRDLVRYNGGVYLNLYVNDDVLYNTKIIACDCKIEEGLRGYTNYYDAVYLMMWSPINLSAYFFCNKDDTIYWNLEYKAIFGEVAITAGMNSTGFRGQNINFQITACSIY